MRQACVRGILACRGNFPRKFAKGNKRKGNKNLRLFEHICLHICEYLVINLPLRLNIALKRREILACVVLYQSCKTSWVWQAETRYPADTRPWNVCTCAQVWPVAVREMSPRSSTDWRPDLRKRGLKCSLHVALPSPLASFLLWGGGEGTATLG